MQANMVERIANALSLGLRCRMASYCRTTGVRNTDKPGIEWVVCTDPQEVDRLWSRLRRLLKAGLVNGGICHGTTATGSRATVVVAAESISVGTAAPCAIR